MNRRHFLQTAFGGMAAVALPPPALAGEVGITTGSFTRHLSQQSREGKLRLLDLPRMMRDQLDMRVLDLMTATLASMEPPYLDELRAAAERAGCTLTNLKLNQPGLELASPDDATRRHALREYKRSMDAAARLGVRWVRPLPGPKRPDLTLLAASYRELIEYGAAQGLGLLVENFGWMKDDPGAIPALIQAVGPDLRAQPDTGNWSDPVRYEGLAQAFPHAVSCDFKAFTLDQDGAHPAYDLQRCFRIGWEAGFRGPWCLEHTQADLPQLLREMAFLRDRLREWMRAAV